MGSTGPHEGVHATAVRPASSRPASRVLTVSNDPHSGPTVARNVNGYREASLQAGHAVERQALVGEVGEELAEEHERQEQREMGQATGDEGRHHAVRETGEETGDVDEVGLVLAAEVGGAGEERGEEGDLRSARQAEPAFFQHRESQDQHQLDAGPHRLDVEESGRSWDRARD